MGSRGPTPKRSEERVRRNVESRPDKVYMPGRVRAPRASRSWHLAARRWFRSLASSGQARYFEPSDWAQAQLTAELLSAEMERADGPRATMVSALMASMRGLGTTESDRRRMRLEIERGEAPAPAPEEDEEVASLEAYWRRASGG